MWRAICGDARLIGNDQDVFELDVRFVEDSGTEFLKKIQFAPDEQVTKQAVKDRLAPDLISLNNRAGLVQVVNTSLKGQDISTW